MIANRKFPAMTTQEYLEWEPTQEMRYEYFNGEVVAMTGGTKPHNRAESQLQQVARNLLQQEMSITEVAQMTGLSESQIEQLNS
ncbi:MAG: Uma2 family endonuclease [Oscillatoria sp. PMC 1068.18]|nr:Uma2 family endonuclease [Oscillatoria sp. PMC 1076.18]MEC4987987.1 Uma2 family endonuclease [Oscillatoria sp. PMC 1068.18]